MSQSPTEPTATTAGLLWAEDTGTLPEASRRALLALVRGPYLDQRDKPQLFSALITDQDAIRSQLHNLFLELHLHQQAGVAFVRNVATPELATPAAVRSHTLTFLDTAMLLVLRQLLLAAPVETRVIVGREEVTDQLKVFRTRDRDEADFRKRLNASWNTMMNKLNVLKKVSCGESDEDQRVEISPVLRLIMDAEQNGAIRAEYQRIAAAEGQTFLDAAEGEGHVGEAAGDDAEDALDNGSGRQDDE
ncbi:MAG: DUF4194 domain-containing protein [Galactobacter sp.]